MKLFKTHQVKTQQNEVQSPKQGSSLAGPLLEGLPYYAKSIETCLEALDSQPSGLLPDQVALRQKQTKKSSDAKDASRSALAINQFRDFVAAIMLLAAVLSLFSGQWTTGLLILGVLTLKMGINFWLTRQAEKNLDGTRPFATHPCTVRRDGRLRQIPVQQLVLGDILVLERGQLIPADARLIETDELKVDESVLTGESESVRKDAQALHIPDDDINAQNNMVFAGTRVKTGKGFALVTALGSHTVMGRVAKLAQGTEKKDTRFSKQICTLNMGLFTGTAVLAALIAGMDLRHGSDMLSVVQMALVFAIAAIPENLSGLITFILSVSAGNLAEHQVLVRRLQALETIGSMSVLCTDKTGTLTENFLTIEQVFLPGLGKVPFSAEWRDLKNLPSRAVEELLRMARLTSPDVAVSIRNAMVGDPVDIALQRASHPTLEKGYRLVKHIPFESEQMRSASIYRAKGEQVIAFSKGAPEVILQQCKFYMAPSGEIVEMTEDERLEYLLINRELALENAQRVLGFSGKLLHSEYEDPYTNGVFVGWMCLKDPPKAGVLETIERLKTAGTRVIMITGDQKATAAVNAKNLGILSDHDVVWSSRELSEWVNETLPDNIAVFARTKPEDKLAIVEALQKNYPVVGMVGDGVNDAPALQRSNVAFAMGSQGSDAARDSADFLLLKDQLEGIVLSIMESKLVQSRLKRTVTYMVSCSVAIIFTLLFATLVNMTLPFSLAQVLWLNLITASLPAMALAFEGGLPVTGKESRAQSSDILSGKETFLMFYFALMIAAASFLAYLAGAEFFHLSYESASTLAFSTMALAQVLNLLNVLNMDSRGDKKGLLQGIVTIPFTWLVVGATLLLQVAAVYTVGLSDVLGTQPLALHLWVWPLGVAVASQVLTLCLVDFKKMG